MTNISRVRSCLSYRATIYDDDFAVHKTVAVAGHKRSKFGEFGGFSESSFRYPEIMHLQQAFGQRVAQIGIEDSGGDGVDRNTEIGCFPRQAFGKTNHRGF